MEIKKPTSEPSVEPAVPIVPESIETDAPPPPESAAIKPPPPRFVGGAPRSRTVPLAWPVEYDGKVYDAITVRRLTVAEVHAFVDSIGLSDGSPRLPMFDCPPEVLDAIDPDDDERLQEAAGSFLPRRFQAAAKPDPSPGAATAPSSPPSSGGPVKS